MMKYSGSYESGVACAAPAVAPWPQPSGVAHMPGPPGALGAFIWLWQQINPAEQEPSTPAVHPQPTPVQGGATVAISSTGARAAGVAELPCRAATRAWV